MSGSKFGQRAESLGINLLSTALWEFVFRGIPVLIAGYATYRASLEGLTAPWVILMGAGAFFLLTVGLHILKAIVWPSSKAKEEISQEVAPVINVRYQKISNQHIPLDNHSYIGCEFKNVTFVYNGGDYYEFVNNKVDGYSVATDNPVVLRTIVFLKAFAVADIPIASDLPPPPNLQFPEMRRPDERAEKEAPRKQVEGFAKKGPGKDKGRKGEGST